MCPQHDDMLTTKVRNFSARADSLWKAAFIVNHSYNQENESIIEAQMSLLG
jgi:hypothetical protein